MSNVTNAKTSWLTETSRFDITFLACRRVRICVTERSPVTNGELLVQTPLFGAGETRFGGVVWSIHLQNGIVRLEADACGSLFDYRVNSGK
jgi:hypothetical protein